MSTFLWTLLLGCLGLVLPAVFGEKVTWCTISAPEKRKCDDLTAVFPDITCVEENGTDACLAAIRDRKADAITLDAGDIYKAGLHDYNLQPVIAEDYGQNSDTCYFAVAVVKRNSTLRFDKLKGRKSCHTGLGKSAGWNIPIGTLLALGHIEWNPVEQSIEEAVSQFFSASCVPGATLASGLCRLCQGTCSRSQDEPYYNYDGAYRCLKEGAGEVAFVKHTTVPAEDSADYQLLCRNGSRGNLSDYASCHLARVPAHAVVTRKEPRLGQTIYNTLMRAKRVFQLFSSGKYSSKNLLFKDSAVDLILLPSATDSFTFLGAEYLSIILSISGVTSSSAVIWCAVGPVEKRKCDQWREASVNGMGDIQLLCTSAVSVDACTRMIMRGEADAVAMDGGDVYSAGGCGLVPAMVEQYDADRCVSEATTETASYYAVAVVRKSSTLTWDGLRGKKSCHTGFGRTAGWNVPMGLIHKTSGECEFSKYFDKACAPGAESGSSLCALCVGNGRANGGSYKCQASTEEQYFGYEGAFRCLVQGGGDVAFVKHTTVPDNTDGQGAPWASGLNSTDFKLLCRTGPNHVAPVSDYLNCNLAKVPAHAVMTRPEKRADVVTFLNNQQARFGPSGTGTFKLFNSEGRKNLLFKDSTKCLQEVPPGQDYRRFLGEDYYSSVTSLKRCDGSVSELEQACTFHTCQQRA